MTTLRLADAILLGDSLKTRDAGTWISRDGSCGCALGGALLAAGLTAPEFWRQIDKEKGSYDAFAELPALSARWPWLSKDAIVTISRMYMRLERGFITIEAIAAYADSIDPTPRIEPPVQEPSQVEVRQEKVTDLRQESTVSHD